MKKINKGICIMLVLIMTVSTFSMTAFACGEKNLSDSRQDYKYTAFGDSICSGFDTDKNSLADFTTYAQCAHCSSEAQFCYPKVLANMLKLEGNNVYNLASLGMKTFVLNDLLEEALSGDEISDKTAKMNETIKDILGFENYFAGENEVEDYISAIKTSDLTTVNIGYNNLLWPVIGSFYIENNELSGIFTVFLVGLMMGATIEGMLDGSDLQILADTIGMEIDPEQMSGINIEDMLKVEDIKALLERFSSESLYNACKGGIKEISDDYPQILKNILALSEKDNVVAVGLHNPYGIKNYYTAIHNAIKSGVIWARLGCDIDAYNYLVSCAIEALNDVDVKELLKSLADEVLLMEEIESEPVLMSEEDMKEATTVLFEDIIFPLMCITVGEGTETVIDEVNSIIEKAAEEVSTEKGVRIKYVDVTGAPSSVRIDPHLDATGHKYFAQQIYNEVTPEVTAKVIGAGGTVSNAGTTEYLLGQDAEYTITANTGYEIDKVVVDGKNVTAEGGKIEFSGLYEDHTISVSFKAVKTNVVDIWGKKNIGYNYFKGFRIFPLFNWFR